jgi:hypothetical protein
MPEVQKHGFTWERDLLLNSYGVTYEELKKIKYNSKMDLPRSLNRKNDVNLSIKTTCSLNAICMGDCLRVYDAVGNGTPLHMTSIYYKQDDNKDTKKIARITEVDLTNSRKLLFGSITLEQLVELDIAVKAVPQKRRPTDEEYQKMYSIRNILQPNSGAIHLDIKCDSQQSRLQCSFNHFQDFLRENPDRIIEQSISGQFRGGNITEEISSKRRIFKKKIPAVPVSDSAPHSPPI